MKTLKEEGVPLGARIVFRLQHAGLLVMVLGLIPTTPFAVLWAMVHESGFDFILGVTDVLEKKSDQVKRHREKLVRMYGGQAT